jgi:hypothetical protein
LHKSYVKGIALKVFCAELKNTFKSSGRFAIIMAKGSSLEQKVKLLDEFIGNTGEIKHFKLLFESAAITLGYGEWGEPGLSFKEFKDYISQLSHKEESLIAEYNRLMHKGKYSFPEGWDYIKELAAEVRRIKHLPENSPIELIDGSPEWLEAKPKVKKSLEERMGKVNYYSSLDAAEGIIRARYDLYSQLLNNWPQIYEAFSSAASEFGRYRGDLQSLQQQVGSHITAFANQLSNLLRRYPRQEYLEEKLKLPSTSS